MPPTTLIPPEQIALLRAFGAWGAATCTFAALALLAIWWHIGRRSRDRGQVYLALSVGFWGVSGLVEVYYAGVLDAGRAAGADLQAPLFRLAAWRSVLSLANSLFILLALPYFRYLPARLVPLVKARSWPWLVGLPFALALLPTVRQLVAGTGYQLVSELDVYYALLTLGFLGAVLWSSFARRRLPSLAYLTALVTIVTVGAQVLKLGADPGTQAVLAAVFKTCLITLFFALALSWVRELAEAATPVLAQAVQLRFHGERRVSLSGFRQNNTAPVRLTPALHDLLSRFAARRTDEDATEGGWLEIKPKHEGRRGRSYDIRDHNEVRRLLHALLDGLYGAGHWAREQHELPLRETLFETDEARPRMIRLALPPAAIHPENPVLAGY